ncbi:MAG: methyltransferase [Roseivirga sp.]|nr:methyltransferase [Roseivirga sp.]
MSHDFYRLLTKAINKLCGHKLHAVVKEDLSYAKDNLFTTNNAPFLKEPNFLNAYKKGKETDKGFFLKGVDLEWRIHTLCWAAGYAQHLEGDFVECGVRTGFFVTSITDYLSFKDMDKRFVLIDSFTGTIPEMLSTNELKRESHGIKPEGDWDSFYQEVTERFSLWPNVEIVKGVVPQILEKIAFDKLAFISLDLNSTIPEMAALEYLWDYLVPGGIIILDDYGYPGFEEQQRAHDKFAKSRNTSVFCLPTCQGVIIKPQSGTR